jgi:hypothetical protein
MEDHPDHPAPEQAPNFQASIDVLTESIAALQNENRELHELIASSLAQPSPPAAPAAADARDHNAPDHIAPDHVAPDQDAAIHPPTATNPLVRPGSIPSILAPPPFQLQPPPFNPNNLPLEQSLTKAKEFPRLARHIPALFPSINPDNLFVTHPAPGLRWCVRKKIS